LKVAMIALLGQLPIVLLQAMDPDGRSYLGYWLAGSGGILILLSFAFRFLFEGFMSLKSK